MENQSATPEEVYESICVGIKKLTDILDTDISNDRRDKIIKHITDLQGHLERLAKRFKRE